VKSNSDMPLLLSGLRPSRKTSLYVGAPANFMFKFLCKIHHRQWMKWPLKQPDSSQAELVLL
jgi:hypothetical protein